MARSPHHGDVLSPSWPSPVASGRPIIPPSVRRRVRFAERRALRRAVQIGSLALAGLLVAEVALTMLFRTSSGLSLVGLNVGGFVLSLGLGFLTRHGLLRPQLAAFSLLVMACTASLLSLSVLPAGRLLEVGQIATLLVGAGLFLPWSQRWHIGGMVACALLSAAFVASPLGAGLEGADRVELLVVVATAASMSVLGHSMWQQRLSGLLEQQFALRNLSRYAQRQETNVTELNRELNVVARRDSLTGVGNRLALDEALARLLDRRGRLRPRRFALVLLDIDHFKLYNDEHGHLVGDAALGRLGEILRSATRDDDLAFRYGGEEFLLLLPDVDLPSALGVAERVRIAVAESHPGEIPPFRISAGVALCDPADGRDPVPLLRRADAAMYIAKRGGRNRIAADELSVAMEREALLFA
jgi:diguanylate cyclase (GGDEF)-like protein